MQYGFGGLAVVVGSLLSTACFAEDRPNIILCMTDDQGWGDVGYNGHPTIRTPILDEMAATGLRLDRAYAAHPVCSPTRASVMTGRHPNRMGCFSWGYTLRPEEVTIAEALKTAGYATGHFGKWHLGSCNPRDDVSPGESGFDTWVSSPNFYDNSPLFSHNGSVARHEGESSQVTVDAAVEFIQQQSQNGQPFLAVIWFGNPHLPLEATPELQAEFSELSKQQQNYNGEILGVDRAMGHLREQLRELKIADNTVLWFTSDNGATHRAGGSTGPYRGQKGDVWEGGLRVPGIIEWPSQIKEPRQSKMRVVTSDIYPTILEIAGVSMEQQPPLDGVSLVPLLKGTMAARETPIGFWIRQTKGLPVKSEELLEEMEKRVSPSGEYPEPPERAAISRMQEQVALDDLPGHAAWTDGNWKLHKIPRKNGSFRFELYDLEQDESEEHNVAKMHADRVKAMRADLLAWQTSVTQSLNGEDY